MLTVIFLVAAVVTLIVAFYVFAVDSLSLWVAHLAVLSLLFLIAAYVAIPSVWRALVVFVSTNS